MNPSINIVILLASIYLSWMDRIEGGHSSFEQTKECSTYSEKLVSFPDLHNMIQYRGRRQQDFEIDSVKNTNRERSFYWCELDIEESDTVYRRYRHFGFNATHWWVEKGCGGWFWVTECKPAVTSPVLAAVHGNYLDTHYHEGDDEEEDDDEGEDKTDTIHDNLSPKILNKVSSNLAPTSGSLGDSSGQTRLSMGDKSPPPSPTPGHNRKVISSGRHTDTKMSYRSNKNAVEENMGGRGDGSPWQANNAESAGHKDLLSPQSGKGVGVDPDRLPHPTITSGAVSSNASVDDLYKGWPMVGYDYPTSREMWEVLDRATWVDVKAQLGFYTKYARGDSIFE